MGGTLAFRARSAVSSLAGRRAGERLGRLIGRGPDYGELYELLAAAGSNVELEG
jgi:hypothetical protein